MHFFSQAIVTLRRIYWPFWGFYLCGRCGGGREDGFCTCWRRPAKMIWMLVIRNREHCYLTFPHSGLTKLQQNSRKHWPQFRPSWNLQERSRDSLVPPKHWSEWATLRDTALLCNPPCCRSELFQWLFLPCGSLNRYIMLLFQQMQAADHAGREDT